MTKEALRQMELSAQQAKTGEGKKAAADIAELIRRYMDRDIILRHVVENPHSKMIFDEASLTITGPHGDALGFRKKEMKLMEMLVSRTGTVVLTGELHQNIPGWSKYGVTTENSPLKAVVNVIRPKLVRIGLCDDDFPGGYLVTVPGKGYAMVDPADPLQVARFKQYARAR